MWLTMPFLAKALVFNPAKIVGKLTFDHSLLLQRRKVQARSENLVKQHLGGSR